MDKPSFDDVWKSIQKHAGETFYTKKGYPFTFKIQGTSIITNRGRWALNNKNLRLALDLWPVEGPGGFNYTIRGPSYVWAILSDNRIIKKPES